MEPKLYTIGEMAKLTNLPIRTLHYYDEIGLFKPVQTDPTTNYRYYSEFQLFNADLIKSLKYIGTPLKKIKDAQELTPEEMISFLAAQQQTVSDKLTKLQEVQYMLMKTQKQLAEQSAIPMFHDIYEKQEESERLLTIQTHGLTFTDDINPYFSALSATLERGGSVAATRYGGIYKVAPYASLDELTYEALFTPLLTTRAIDYFGDNMETIDSPSGTFLCIAFPYTKENYFRNYQKLYETVSARHLANARVYELFLPTSFSPSIEPEYIVELKVPVTE